MAFTWFKSEKKGKPLGETLGNSESIKAEIQNMQGSIVKTSRTYQDNIKKYKEIAKFNQQLTKSYVENMKVIVDVSELLNSYANVFSSLRDEFGKMEEAMGKPLDFSDFQYLENLTKNKIETLNSEFQKQSEGIKKLYAEYGKPEELNRILMAQGDVQRVIDNATDTYSTIEKTTANQASNKNINALKTPKVEEVLQPLRSALSGGKVKASPKGNKSSKKTSNTCNTNTTKGTKTTKRSKKQ
jgi:hypothetical protein